MSDAEYFKPAKEAVNGFINIQNTWASLTTKEKMQMTVPRLGNLIH